MKIISGSRRFPGIDVLRALAAFAVVMIHTPVSANETELKKIILGVLPFANGVFAVMAGFFLLESLYKYQNWQSFLKSRFRRLILPYIIWSLIYLLLNIAFDLIRKEPSAFDFARFDCWVSIVFAGGAGVQLWFLAALFYVQLFIFFVFSFCKEQFQKQVSGLLFVLLGVLCIAVYSKIDNDSFVRSIIFMFGYVLFGLALNNSRFWTLKNGVIYRNISIAVVFFLSMLSLCSIQVCLGFLVIKTVLWVVVALSFPSIKINAFVNSLGRESMTIYLAHVVFTTGLPFVYKILVTDAFTGLFFLIALVAYFASWGSALLFKYIWDRLLREKKLFQ